MFLKGFVSLCRVIVFVACFFILSISAFATKSPINYRSKFIASVLKETELANHAILKERKTLLAMYKKSRFKKTLLQAESKRISALAEKYAMPSFDVRKKADWETLLSRVDIMPPSLVTAQAIYESNWGRSRFAKEANNFFGQHCYQVGCGVVPKHRPAGLRFEVRRFMGMKDSVDAYIHNLNTKSAYKKLRRIRVLLQKKNKQITGHALAEGLDHYSEQDVYVKNIRHIIAQYGLG